MHSALRPFKKGPISSSVGVPPRQRVVTATVILGTILGLTACVDGTGLSVTDELVFAQHTAGNTSAEIKVIRVTGGGERTLASHPAWDLHPAWSPDGRRIAFSSRRDSGYEIYVMDADGSGVRRLTDDPVRQSFAPSWSPDGSLIAFEGDGLRPNIHVVPATGGPVRSITAAGPGFEQRPSWSPDGARLAFQRLVSTGMHLFVIDTNGTGDRNVTDTLAGSETFPSWSPDGSRLVFQREDGIYTITVNGSEYTKLPLPPGAACPDWSPDGAWLAVIVPHEPVNNWEIYVVRLNGTDSRRVTHNELADLCPKWRPR